MEIYIHIGASKTASTTIQSALILNYDSLIDNAIVVPGDNMCLDSGTKRGQQIWYFEKLLKLPIDEAREKLRNDITSLLVDARKKYSNIQKVLLSGENLFRSQLTKENVLKPVHFPEIISVLSDIAPVKLFVYLRRQDDFLASAWGQWAMKSGITPSEFLSTHNYKLGYWNDLLEGYKNVFSVNNISVNLLDKEYLINGSIIEDFFFRIGCSDIDLKLPEVENRTLDESLLLLMGECPDLFKGVHDNDLINLIKMYSSGDIYKDSSKSILFTYEERLEIYELHKPGNSAVRNTYLPDWPKPYLFDPPEKGDFSDNLEKQHLIEMRQRRFLSLFYGLLKSLSNIENRMELSEKHFDKFTSWNKNLKRDIEILKKDKRIKLFEKRFDELISRNDNLKRDIEILKKENESKAQSIVKLQNELTSCNGFIKQIAIQPPLQKGLKSKLRLIKHIWIIKKSNLFDADWYLKVYPDVSINGMNPIKHYLIHGWRERRNPSPNFITEAYLARRPDVAAAGICPLVHYILFGREEEPSSDK